MQRIVCVILFLCAFAFAGDISFGSLSNSKAQGPANRSGIAMAPSYAEEAVDSSYVLGPGDFLDIMLEQSYLTVQIYPDGSVAIEECGTVNVAGKTLAEARELILDLASKRYKREQCFVQLAALKRFRVNAMGAVGQVGQHLVEPQTRLSYFMRQVGGTIARANTEDVQVIRGKDTIHVNYTDMSIQGDFSNDIMLQQGDKVFVPFVTIVDNVTLIFPDIRTSVAYKEGRTLQEYYDMAGGNRRSTPAYKAACVREPGKEHRWVTLTEMKQTTVAPNTEVEFSTQVDLVYVGGAVNAVGRYPYDPEMHAIDYISAAGINPMTGSWGQVKVWRGSKPEALDLSVTTDPILPGDYIEIPRSRYESFKDFTLFMASLLSIISSALVVYINFK
ncbi:MAG: polysaccharide biosynthesis/export family protein [Fibrobacter sp.]|nr:polysaccharide biosynthesis/export family protein [Fibrobacter sp.]